MLRLKLLKIKQSTLLNELLILHLILSIINLAATAALHVKLKD